MKVAGLGTRLVGEPMAIDLAVDGESDLTVADIDGQALDRPGPRLHSKDR